MIDYVKVADEISKDVTNAILWRVDADALDIRNLIFEITLEVLRRELEKEKSK